MIKLKFAVSFFLMKINFLYSYQDSFLTDSDYPHMYFYENEYRGKVIDVIKYAFKNTIKINDINDCNQFRGPEEYNLPVYHTEFIYLQNVKFSNSQNENKKSIYIDSRFKNNKPFLKRIFNDKAYGDVFFENNLLLSIKGIVSGVSDYYLADKIKFLKYKENNFINYGGEIFYDNETKFFHPTYCIKFYNEESYENAKNIIDRMKFDGLYYEIVKSS